MAPRVRGKCEFLLREQRDLSHFKSTMDLSLMLSAAEKTNASQLRRATREMVGVATARMRRGDEP